MLEFLLAFHGAADKLGGCKFLTANIGALLSWLERYLGTAPQTEDRAFPDAVATTSHGDVARKRAVGKPQLRNYRAAPLHRRSAGIPAGSGATRRSQASSQS